MRLLILLCLVTNTISYDCIVCLDGRCHSRGFFYGNFNSRTDACRKISKEITDAPELTDIREQYQSTCSTSAELRSGRMVVDYNDNIMYLLDDGIDVIHLDNQTLASVPMIAPGHQIAIDHDTGDIYYYRNRKFKNIYKYQLKTNKTDTIYASIGNKQPPFNLFVNNGTIYFNTHKENGHEFAKGLNYLNGSTVEKVQALENIIVIDVKFDKFGSMYINTGNEIYRLKANEEKPILFTEGKYLLSEDRNKEVYFFETTKRFFYKVDGTDKLTNIGAYDDFEDGGERPKLQGFYFDRDNNIILKDIWSIVYKKHKATSTQCVFEYQEARNRTVTTEINPKY